MTDIVPPDADAAPRGGRFRSLEDPESLRAFVHNLREGVYISDAQGRVLDANPAMLALMGLTTIEELRAYSGERLIVDGGRREQELAIVAREGFAREFELEIRRPDGAMLTVLDTTYAVRDPETGETFYHGILVDISARKQLEQQLRDLCVRDPLTGAYNRRYLLELERQMQERDVSRWGCLYIDIDHFKEINDRYGHLAGDEMLEKMVRFLMRQVRAEESVVRLGGDEFLLVLCDAGPEQTEAVARRLQLEALRSAPTAFSLGWAARQDGEPFERTVNRADQQLLAVRVVERTHAPERRQD